jgi:hypothetical protein
MDKLGGVSTIDLHLHGDAKRGLFSPDTAWQRPASGRPPVPLLFILAIDPLNCLLQVATDRGLLSPLNGWTARFRVSMYTDDTIIFLKLSIDDVNNLTELLSNFGLVTDCKQTYKRRQSLRSAVMRST